MKFLPYYAALIYNSIMTATAHALVAGAIANKIPDPTIATTLSFFSHFIMDTVPHWDIGTNWRFRARRLTGILAIFDTAIGITLTYFLFSQKVNIIILTFCIVASLLPDWLETPWYILFANAKKHGPSEHAGMLEVFTYRLYKIENIFHTKTQFPLGLITQILSVGFFFFLLR